MIANPQPPTPNPQPLMSVYTIQRMRPDVDLAAVLEVEAASFINPWTPDMFAWELRNPQVSHIYVLRAGEERVAAYCSCWLVDHEWHINNLAVRPEWRGQGLARALLDHVLREASRLGAHPARLEVRRSNDIARRLYEGMGFAVVGTRRNYYTNPPEDALILSRDRSLETP